jgi:transcriptional regulator with XRE-family HTH domain
MAKILSSFTNILSYEEGLEFCAGAPNVREIDISVCLLRNVRTWKRGPMDRSSIYEVLGGNIRRERAGRDLNQSELAELVGLSRTSITNVELGRQALSVHQLFDFATALGVLPAQLLPTESPEKASKDAEYSHELAELVAKLRTKSRRT